MKKNYFLSLLMIFVLIGCSISKDKMIMPYNKAICEYKVESINKISISGFNATNGVSLANRPKVTSILSGSVNSIPLVFTVNIDIENKSKNDINFSDIPYAIYIDNILFDKGQITEDLKIQAKETSQLALPVNIDIKNLMNEGNKKEITEITKSLIGLNSRKINIVIMLDPKYKIKIREIKYPSPLYLNYLKEKQ